MAALLDEYLLKKLLEKPPTKIWKKNLGFAKGIPEGFSEKNLWNNIERKSGKAYNKS